MATYKIIGTRFLRKYEEPSLSPVYAASVEAQTIVRDFCNVPWAESRVRDARMTYHTDEFVAWDEAGKGTMTGLDHNAANRDDFDAALYCAGHKGNLHRAYANAAVYRYALPDAAVGATLSSIALDVTTDPYNSQGVRIHVFTNGTGEIPMNCHTVRGEDQSGAVVEDGTTAAAAVKRTVRTIDGTDYWYPNNEIVTVSPTGGLTLQKYLFVLVALESYSTTRGNWLEGCSFIRNLAALTTADDVPGWTDGETYDLAKTSFPVFAVARDGILPGVAKGVAFRRSLVVRTDANAVANAPDGSQNAMRNASGVAAAAALSRIYADFFAGEGVIAEADVAQPQGASFSVARVVDEFPTPDSDRPTAVESLRLDSSILLVPFALPSDVPADSLSLDFAPLDCSPGARFNVFLAAGEYLTALQEDVVRDPALYDGRNPPYPLLGSISSGQSAAFPISQFVATARVATAIVTGWLPPESYSWNTNGSQGTGILMPDVSII